MYTRDMDSAAFFLNLQPTLLNPAVQLSASHLPPQFHWLQSSLHSFTSRELSPQMTYKERVSVGQGTSLDKLSRANDCTNTCSSKSCSRNNSIQWWLSPWLFFALSIPTCPPPSIHPPCIHDHHPCYCIIRPAFQPHNAISYEHLTTMGEGRRALSSGWPKNLKSRIQMKHCNAMHPNCKCNFWL